MRHTLKSQFLHLKGMTFPCHLLFGRQFLHIELMPLRRDLLFALVVGFLGL